MNGDNVKRDRIFWAALIAVGIILRLHTLDTGFWFDELLSFTLHGRVPLGAIPVMNVDGGDHMLLHYLYHASRWLFGPHEWASRLPDFLAGVAFLLLVGRFVRDVCGDRAVSLLAVGFVATCPTHVMYSQYARGYGLQMLFALGVFWISWKALENPDWRPGQAEAAAGLLAFCGIYNSITWALFITGMLAATAAWGWLAGVRRPAPERSRARRLFFAFALSAAAAYAAFQPVLPQTLYEANNQQMPNATAETRLSATYLELSRIVTRGFTPWILLFAVPGFAALARERPRLFFLFLGPLLVPPVVLLATHRGAPGRHVLFLYPVLVATLCRGVLLTAGWLRDRIGSRPDPGFRLRWAGILLVPVALLHATWLWTDYYTRWRANDLRIVRDAVRARVGPHDLLMVNIPDSFGLLGYYLGDEIETRMLAIIRDRKLTGLWYAARPPEPQSEHGRILHPDWIGPEGIPPSPGLAVGRLFTYFPVEPGTAGEAAVPVPFDGARWVADFGAIRLYRIAPERIERLDYAAEGGDREATLHPYSDLRGTIAPDRGRVLEGTASIRVGGSGRSHQYFIPPAMPLSIPEGAWWLAMGAVSRRDRVDLVAQTIRDEGEPETFRRFRANNCVGPRNHLFGDARTHDALQTDWIPSCWIGLPPAGACTMREIISAHGPGWIDGIQSYIIHFKEPGGK